MERERERKRVRPPPIRAGGTLSSDRPWQAGSQCGFMPREEEEEEEEWVEEEAL